MRIRSASFSALLVIATATVGSAVSPAPAPFDLAGRASVVDGDTIEIGGERIRLEGIDAPESRQSCLNAGGVEYSCGKAAAHALAEFLARSRPTFCSRSSRDRYGRTVGTCRRADGSDAAAFLVRQGHALDWPRYSRGRHAAEQEAARKQKAGLWQGRFTEPWNWRRKS